MTTDRAHARVLVADDEDSIRFVLRETLEAAGHEVDDVSNGDAAFEKLAASSFDLAFLDIRMPGPSGLELLDRLAEIGCDTAVVIITAQNTFENAVEAMKRGALEYLVKPFSIAEASALADKALRTRALEQEVKELRREVGGAGGGTERLVGTSAAMLEIFKNVGRVARSNVSVLITGESGTGKELVARAIHGASPRGAAPFVAVNAAAIPRELLESELFGHERGAFTGATRAAASDASARRRTAGPCSWTRSERCASVRAGPSCSAPCRSSEVIERLGGNGEPDRGWMCASSPPPTATWIGEHRGGQLPLRPATTASTWWSPWPMPPLRARPRGHSNSWSPTSSPCWRA